MKTSPLPQKKKIKRKRKTHTAILDPRKFDASFDTLKVPTQQYQYKTFLDGGVGENGGKRDGRNGYLLKNKLKLER